MSMQAYYPYPQPVPAYSQAAAPVPPQPAAYPQHVRSHPDPVVPARFRRRRDRFDGDFGRFIVPFVFLSPFLFSSPYPYYPYTPYAPFTPYSPYAPYSPYTSYAPYSPYSPYTPYSPYSFYSPNHAQPYDPSSSPCHGEYRPTGGYVEPDSQPHQQYDEQS
ncbi:MAG: hypothetical protein H0Z34_06585 [Brevibacillus sp.]|nr:hypothetical protein [Brevibacillus sp.]